ncbi:MAG: DUF2271 domain-containing protein [Planctomycetales bacterium]|nr:DUF2271 domain-containing protein [Planctomycetales bacterium]
MNRSVGRIAASLLASTLLLFGSVGRAEDFAFFHEHVLGTSLELRVRAESFPAAQRAEQAALAEINRLSAIYSHYDASSELSKFARTPQGQRVEISPELAKVLRLCEQWSQRSEGAFNPGVEPLAKLWRDAAQRAELPGANELASSVRAARGPHWQLSDDGAYAVRVSDAGLTLNAIAKGVILDRVAATLQKLPQVGGVLINIGGDIRVAGALTAKVLVADSRGAIGNSRNSPTLKLAHGAVATSGDAERYLEIGGRRYSHILDPRSGQPVSHHPRVTVLAGDAATADVLATICSVLPTDESLELVESLADAECILTLPDGRMIASSNWPGEPPQYVSVGEKSPHELLLQFEIARPAGARQYRRPYVAVWIEDKDGFPVKTLSLFLMKNNPGPRWHRDLRRWYRGEQLRRAVEELDVIETVSNPTRNPGKYKVAWDGRDNAGKLLPPGEYTLLIESAREHGAYRLIKTDFTFGKSFTADLKSNEEISSAKVEYTVK